MKIAYILPSIINKGSITIFKDLINCINNLYPDIQIDVFYFKKHDINFFDYKNVKKISLLKKIELNEYDIIHSSGIIPNFYTFFYKKRVKATFVTTIHSYLKEDLSNSYNKIQANIINFLWLKILSTQDCVAVLTNDAKKYYLNKINTKISVVNNGRDFNKQDSVSDYDIEIEKIIEIKKKYKIIGSNAVISKIKGIEQVLYSLVYLKDYFFVLVGDGNEKTNLIDLSKSLGVYERCLFVDFKNNINSYTELYDLYVMPSRSEGFGLALIEAISLDIPCLCSDIPVFKELFNEEEIIFFELDNIEDLVLKMKILENQDIVQKLILNAKAKYLTNFTSTKMTHNYISLYKSLISQQCSL